MTDSAQRRYKFLLLSIRRRKDVDPALSINAAIIVSYTMNEKSLAMWDPILCKRIKNKNFDAMVTQQRPYLVVLKMSHF